MPQDAMEWWNVAGVIIGGLGLLAALYFGWRGLSPRRQGTCNIVEGGDRNRLQGGPGETTNIVRGGDDNTLSG